MTQLKKLFPFSFRAKKDLAALIIDILIYILVGAVVGILIGVFAKIPLVGILFSLVGALVEIYVLAGIVLLVLDYLKLLK